MSLTPPNSLPPNLGWDAPRVQPTAAPIPSPPAFKWEEWYAAAGGRSISIEEVNGLRGQILQEQVPRFTGPIAPVERKFASPAAAAHLKERATVFGADLVGFCEIAPSDVYQGREVTERYAISVAQRMRWREFQVVPSKESAIECMRRSIR
jgi:hypothetical protein